MTRRVLIQLSALSVWLGAAILSAAVVAPAAFRMLPSRAMAGAVVGQVLPVIFWSGIFAGIIAWGLEARTTPYTLRKRAWAPFAIMIAGCAIAQLVIAPKIEKVRHSVGNALDSLDRTDPRRVAFGKLHGISVLCMGVAMLGAATSVGLKIHHTKS
jgi:hypothetical protein